MRHFKRGYQDEGKNTFEFTSFLPWHDLNVSLNVLCAVASWAIDSEPIRARGIIVLVKSN